MVGKPPNIRESLLSNQAGSDVLDFLNFPATFLRWLFSAQLKEKLMTARFGLTIILTVFLTSCISLSGHERRELYQLDTQGISVETPPPAWEAPASPAAAGMLNLLPGFGNFYLASGNAADRSQYLVGAVNFALWPFSVLWGIPQTVVDAQTINERDLLYFQTYEAPKTGPGASR